MKTEQIYKIFRQDSAGISIDSRLVEKGQIFFALRGQNNNGNKFASAAIERGALYAIIDDPVFESEKTILVDDCLAELQSLASYHRNKMQVPVLAITGTNGKTTTKELIAAVLSKKYKVHYTKGNLNNEIGLPVTILSAPSDTEFMVLEMGANHIGEIKTLCRIARPDYGIITNIGTAHIEGFGSLEGVLKAKTELYEFLSNVNGIALYNDKDPVLTDKIYRMINRAVPFSNPAGFKLVIDPVTSDLRLSAIIKYRRNEFKISTSLFGEYNIENIRAAFATGLFLGVDINDIASTIENYKPGNNRSEVKDTGRNTLICDSYNANPTSMMNAIGSFIQIRNDKKVLILGDMLELGDKRDEEHNKIINLLESLNLRHVYLVGPAFVKASEGKGFLSFQETGDLCNYLRSNPMENSLILIKGSRRMMLEKVYDFL